jgi:hypothetical protein
MYRILIVLSFVAFMGCKDNSTAKVEQTPAESSTESSTETTSTETVTPPPANSFASLPLFPQEKAKILFEQCDYLGMIFHTYSGKSMNVQDADKAKGLMANLLTLRVPENPVCRNAFAYISFTGQGKTLAEADVFFETGCTYLVFRENNQYSAICQMGEKGIQALNLISQDLYNRGQQSQ